MVSDEALKKLQEQIAAWPMERRFVVQQLIEDYRRNREDLRAYKATGLEPEEVNDAVVGAKLMAKSRLVSAFGVAAERLLELAEADKDGRVVVLPCKVGERWTDEDGRAVRITAVIVSIEPFGTNINIYFDYEDATPDDAGSDCVANWDYFSRHYGKCGAKMDGAAE